MPCHKEECHGGTVLEDGCRTGWLSKRSITVTSSLRGQFKIIDVGIQIKSKYNLGNINAIDTHYYDVQTYAHKKTI